LLERISGKTWGYRESRREDLLQLLKETRVEELAQESSIQGRMPTGGKDDGNPKRKLHCRQLESHPAAVNTKRARVPRLTALHFFLMVSRRIVPVASELRPLCG
jgi:hypothetical protein